ncbi:MAG: acetyl-CoA carboxylase biotin carboxylase subunit [Eubacteriales bacterium]
MIEKILIANRGEIAVRIIRACQEMNIKTVAVYSEADEEALHAQIADEAVCIGPARSTDSYLNQSNLLSAAICTGCDAIHPGFGFLSENADFAEKCDAVGIKFIGPRSETINQMGDKSNAKETMKRQGVPVIPGTDHTVTDVMEGQRLAEEIGYPVMIKATAGGGGRGIRLVRDPVDFADQMQSAMSEALGAFGNGEVYIERFVENPKHIEVQILADQHGNVIHLGERDCSIQRRNQKVIEEAPSCYITPEVREQMGQAAILAAKAVGYEGAGTVEFLVDKNMRFYFMEMNTRIQVEHPITEMVTGVDIVREQIRIASGLPLSYTQKDIVIRGHSIECRICAEDPFHNFRPCAGTITALHFPGGPGVRFDSAVYQGYTIPPYYDSMIAKLIVHAPNRNQAIMRMRRALAETVVQGVETNIDYNCMIIKDKDYIAGDFDVTFLQKKDFS